MTYPHDCVDLRERNPGFSSSAKRRAPAWAVHANMEERHFV
jgi:hypothetical protein